MAYDEIIRSDYAQGVVFIPIFAIIATSSNAFFDCLWGRFNLKIFFPSPHVFFSMMYCSTSRELSGESIPTISAGCP
jgi:hypothetical protein